jgi:hypothetical protein
MVRGFTVVFNQPVELDAGLISLRRADGAEFVVTAANPSNDGRTWQLGFFGPEAIGSSLPDGRYTLRIPAGAAVNALGQTLASDHTAAFHRLFGDIDGDADVDAADRAQFKKASGSAILTARYVSGFDFNSDGLIGAEDQFEFDENFGEKLPLA